MAYLKYVLYLPNTPHCSQLLLYHRVPLLHQRPATSRYPKSHCQSANANQTMRSEETGSLATNQKAIVAKTKTKQQQRLLEL